MDSLGGVMGLSVESGIMQKINSDFGLNGDDPTFSFFLGSDEDTSFV